ncbi:hypothetical protein LTR17_015047 [Elasticomyces elasticus]|nr:hypothetical protein LTR17_015047 [Elasticomyces elasticus]
MHEYNKIWIKRVLTLFWAIELIWLLIVFILSCVNLAQYGSLRTRTIWVSFAYIELPFAIFSIALDTTAIILFACYKLRPIPYLVFQCLTAACWTTVLIMDLIVGTQRDLFFSVVLSCTTIGQIAYGAVIVHRMRIGKLPLDQEGSNNGAPRGSYAALGPKDAKGYVVVRTDGVES